MNSFLSLPKHIGYFRGSYINFKNNYPNLPLSKAVFKFFLPWHHSLNSGESPFTLRKPWLTFSALEMLENIVKPGWNIFEYGMGGSTLFWLDKGGKVFSVEHDEAWFERMNQMLKQDNRITAHFREGIAPGEHPVTDDRFCSAFGIWTGLNFESYVRTAEMVADESIHLALIDGRARVASAFAMITKIKPGGYLVLDNAERAQYLPVHNKMQRLQWKVTHCAGPAAFEKGMFWCTSFWQKPE